MKKLIFGVVLALGMVGFSHKAEEPIFANDTANYCNAPDYGFPVCTGDVPVVDRPCEVYFGLIQVSWDGHDGICQDQYSYGQSTVAILD